MDPLASMGVTRPLGSVTELLDSNALNADSKPVSHQDAAFDNRKPASSSVASCRFSFLLANIQGLVSKTTELVSFRRNPSLSYLCFLH